MTSDNETDLETDELNGEDTPEPKDTGYSLAPLFIFCLMGLMLLSFLMLPWADGVINSIGISEKRDYLGTVQKITYVGNFGPDTQIDTESRTLLLRGPVVIEKGVPLEQRVGNFYSDVCLVKTDQCWHLMGS
jgi:hypothetical protein